MNVIVVIFRKHNHIFKLNIWLFITFDLSNSLGKIFNWCLFFNGPKGIRKSDLLIVSLLKKLCQGCNWHNRICKVGPRWVSVYKCVCSLNTHNEIEALAEHRLSASWPWISSIQLFYDSLSGDEHLHWKVLFLFIF